MNTERRAEFQSKRTHEPKEESPAQVVTVVSKEQLAHHTSHPSGDTSRFEQSSLVTPNGNDVEWNGSAEPSPQREIPLFISVLGEHYFNAAKKEINRERYKEIRKKSVENWRKNNSEKFRAQAKKQTSP